jgi:hypothetical protein
MDVPGSFAPRHCGSPRCESSEKGHNPVIEIL